MKIKGIVAILIAFMFSVITPIMANPFNMCSIYIQNPQYYYICCKYYQLCRRNFESKKHQED